jgi:hypothetical protein
VFWDNFFVLFLANCLLNILQNNHYSIRRQDANTVVKEINSAPFIYIYIISQFIETIHDKLQSFRLAKFSFTPRECNMAAQTLAKEATRYKVEQIWLEDFPLSILSIVTREQHCP